MLLALTRNQGHRRGMGNSMRIQLQPSRSPSQPAVPRPRPWCRHHSRGAATPTSARDTHSHGLASPSVPPSPWRAEATIPRSHGLSKPPARIHLRRCQCQCRPPCRCQDQSRHQSLPGCVGATACVPPPPFRNRSTGRPRPPQQQGPELARCTAAAASASETRLLQNPLRG